MNSFSHLNAAVSILNSYDGKVPFALFIKKYFAGDKKYGSRDRKQISSFCYNYFRLGNAALNISTEERILLATSVCEGIRQHQLPDTRLASIKEIFPYQDELSDGIEADRFNESFLIQPKLFLRIRPGNENRVAGKLSGAGLQYEKIPDNCIALPNTSKVDAVIQLDKEAVVQDYNSQRTGDFIKLQTKNHKLQTSIWDCCAASGGKSIMAYDINPNIELTVSDKRESILENLQKRFARAGIKNYNWFVADLASPSPLERGGARYDLIIADMPCTGSGTWSRTPEQLFYFKKEQIENYATLQRQILQNVIPQVKKGGHLLYITCSVFKKENEEIVQYIQQKHNLQIIKMEILKGYEMKADTLFAALFTL